MVNIEYISVNSSADSILLKVSTVPGQIISSILVWDKDNYKDYPTAYDVSSYLSGTSNVEVLSIPSSELNTNFISGVYFVEATSDEVTDNSSFGIVANLTSYYECLFSRLNKISIKDCGAGKYNNSIQDRDNSTYLLSSLLQSIPENIEKAKFTNIVSIMNSIEEICDPCCNTYNTEIVGPSYTWGTEPFAPSDITIVDSNGDPVLDITVVDNIITINDLPLIPCFSGIAKLYNTENTLIDTFAVTANSTVPRTLPDEVYDIQVDGVSQQIISIPVYKNETINITAQ